MLWALSVLLAAAPAAARDRKPASAGQGGSLVDNRSKTLDFDADVLEGMNKNPLDSLTRLGKSDDKQQGHLYRRKSHFRREMRQTVQEMGYTQ
jgi:hypothetical protein